MAAATDPLVPLMRTPDHPPYAEMICDAIISLREEGGSSEHSISKHIESTYMDLPPAHTNLLTYHISKLTRLDEILQPIPGFYTLTTPHYPNPSLSPPRKRGRHPESVALLCGPPRRSPKHPDPNLDLAPLETSIEPPRQGWGRGRGRGKGRGRGRPPLESGGESPRSGRGRGRGKGRGRPPLESGGEEPHSGRGQGRGRGRGRQPELKAAGNENGGLAPVRRRGRPPKAVVIDGGVMVGLLLGPTTIDGGDVPRSPKTKPKEAEAVLIETEERVDEVALLN